MSGEPMTDERLEEIETRNRTLRVPWPYALELIAEVRRLREQLRLANIDAFECGNHAEGMEAERDAALARVAELEADEE
jgi:hypothetical protein